MGLKISPPFLAAGHLTFNSVPVVFKIWNAAKMNSPDLRLGLLYQRFDFLCDLRGVYEEEPTLQP